jgi:hypothetical protein
MVERYIRQLSHYRPPSPGQNLPGGGAVPPPPAMVEGRFACTGIILGGTAVLIVSLRSGDKVETREKTIIQCLEITSTG